MRNNMLPVYPAKPVQKEGFVKFSKAFLLVAALVLVAIPVVAQTTAGDTTKSCSLATLKGTYAKFEHGTIIAQLPGFPPPPVLTASVVIVTYDGAGNASGRFTGTFNGVVFSGTGTSTYTVNGDCTYSEEITIGDGFVSHVAGTVTGAGIHQEVQFIYTDSWLVSFGTIKKM